VNAPTGFDLRANASAAPLEEIDVSDPQLYFGDAWHPYV